MSSSNKQLRAQLEDMEKLCEELHSEVGNRGDKIRKLSDTIAGQAILIGDMNDKIAELEAKLEVS